MNAKLDSNFEELKALIAKKQGAATSPDAPTAIVMKASVHPPKSFEGNSDDVDHFLRKVKQYLSRTQIPVDQQLEKRSDWLRHFMALQKGTQRQHAWKKVLARSR